MTESLAVEYGSHRIDFSVTHVERTTLDIAVTPAGAVEVRAPIEASAERIADRVRRRARWILAQQRYFSQFGPRTTERRWVPGETHLYLGKQYRVRIGDPAASARRVRLSRGFLLIDGVAFEDSASIERAVRAWYRTRAAAVFARRLELCATRFEGSSVTPTSVRLRTMRTRWGSMSASGCLTLNPDLVRASNTAIDYVITHELAHRIIAHHGREFWELLAAVMPDHATRKLHLERVLV